ncbi:MAG: zf-HC2 domain-containing protein [Chloroflexi bacterium]|nr:zf-HC2 domain-containing protein [Chloroflexota bacterium]
MGLKFLDHRFAVGNLSPYIDGQLAPRERERIERHLRTCPLCRQELAELRTMRALLRRAPQRRVPRSFTLPLSAQNEQAAFRRWNTLYGALRVAAVAASLALVLFLSGDVLIARGVIPLSSERAPSAPEPLRAAESRGAEVTRVVEKVVVEQEGSPMAMKAIAPTQPAEVPAAPMPPREGLGGGGGAPREREPLAMEAEPVSPAEGAAPQAMIAAQPEATTGLPAEGDFASPPSRRAEYGLAAPAPAAQAGPQKGAESTSRLADRGLLPPSAPAQESGAQAIVGAIVETATPMATDTPMPSPTIEPLATPTPMPVAAHLTRRPPTSGEVHGLEGDELSPMWHIWRTVRILAATSLGILLVLLAGLLWVGQKRRI